MQYSLTQLKAIYNFKVAEARESFLAFRFLMDPTLKDCWFVRETARELQDYYEQLLAGEKPMLIIQAPPQHGKSILIVDFIGWVSGKHPELKTIYASFSDRLGVRANLRLQRTYTRKTYKDIFPTLRFGMKDYARSREFLEYGTNGGFFRNTTTQGSITGESLDLGVIDDPIKGREAANSTTVREKTWDWFTDDFFTRFSEEAGFLMILTRWHIDDPAARLISSEPRVRVLTYKAIATEDEEFRKEGEALIPEHKSIEFLESRKKVMAKSSFESLYQQNPVITGGNMFKLSWLNYVNREPYKDIVWEKRWITVDSALKAKEHNDYTVYSAFGLYEGKVFFTDMFRGKPKSKEREVIAKAFYNDNDIYPFAGMFIEQKASGIDLFQRMEDDGYMVVEVERNVDKVFRAENITPYLDVHGLYVFDDLPNLIAFQDEYIAFPNAPHDDIMDTVIDGVEIGYKQHAFDYDKML